MDDDAREIELEALSNIYPELKIDARDKYSVTLSLKCQLDEPLKFEAENGTESGNQFAELTWLPNLNVSITLPEGYPDLHAPIAKLSSIPQWLPNEIITELQNMVNDLWEDVGHGQVLFAYFDVLQESARRAFDLKSKSSEIFVEKNQLLELVDFHTQALVAHFNQSTFSCGVCIKSKKGKDCYKISQCGHVFCKECLQDYYTALINEGDIFQVQCIEPGCDKQVRLTPAELLQLQLPVELINRYVSLYRKKTIESDKMAIFCPRKWCQQPARSKKYPKLGSIMEMTNMKITHDSNEEEEEESVEKNGQLAICEVCDFAFCKICFNSWHGPYYACRSAINDESKLSVEEQASYEWLRRFSAECPTCRMAIVKSSGCNHITCSQCKGHMCYVCGAWIDGANPYAHFNKRGTDCYQRLWDSDDQAGQLEGGYAGVRRYEFEFENAQE